MMPLNSVKLISVKSEILALGRIQCEQQQMGSSAIKSGCAGETTTLLNYITTLKGLKNLSILLHVYPEIIAVPEP